MDWPGDFFASYLPWGHGFPLFGLAFCYVSRCLRLTFLSPHDESFYRVKIGKENELAESTDWRR